MKNKSKVLMIILTLIFPGIGNIYVGDKKRGGILAVSTLLVTILGIFVPILSMFLMPIYIYAIISSMSYYNTKNSELKNGASTI